jgi:hypothetical protein
MRKPHPNRAKGLRMIELVIRFSIASTVISWMVFIAIDILQAFLCTLVRILETRQSDALSGPMENQQP